MNVEVILASKAGFCFGVKRAVDEALNTQKKFDRKIYTLGPLIHNTDVVKYLESEGIYSINLSDINTLKSDDIIIIRSHGVSKDVMNLLKSRFNTIIDATCPYVSSIHKKVFKYYNKGYSILIVGDETHPEVIGINGWCDNRAIISRNGSNLEKLPNKLCIVSQTTEKQSNWDNVLAIVSKKCKEFIAFNTICSSTELRQKSAGELSKKVDLMVVLGGRNSSNTTKLYEICKSNCINTIHVENSGEMPDDIINIKTKVVGVTAGASTPDWIIKEAIVKMSQDNNVEVNEQLAYMEKNDNQIIVGKIIEGTVISVSEKEAFLNIGYKVDGVLPKSEVTKSENEDLRNLISVDQKMKVKVIRRKDENGNVVLSKIEIEREKAYKEVKEAFENGSTLNILVKESVNGGLVANYNGIRVFIPASHVELFHVEDLSKYIDKELDVKIIEFEEKRKSTRIVASRRKILKEERVKKEEATWESLQKDTIVEGEVKRITNFGAFVDVQGIDGLLHVSEICWGRVEKPEDVLKIGQKVRVYILDIDKDKKKLSLSIKKLIDDPWNNVDIKYPVGSIVLGKVVRFASFGAFIELEPGVDALVHISQISHKRINKPDDALEIGQKIKAKILDVNKVDKKIGLSIKEVDEI
ncbi:bifunctional 4-hydroxy-3-methylbut-2-enyl diphosphate reductase/30S ribosomal protein S1 [Clostridium fermenticellae]|uniref:4-hydroxy-3-methylbut-2-enyl diphosphate reductase n=1 Tax=Clostridium fermenticellae TaxID=2068654 RepID=A0A386H441_9CLOT|nr:bifunctional 4-hydroxy-3-methylbut-2-enyl diphosphate reductase/30S ribosomal protein S1 [Clostridium fermenticellae]AYD40303.1 bifunctional 4-hydroxy-3-methylbut-2-enyl diphosphate reductase/30S ribosomal protein S1 [Clostridium fermenticellae]